MGAKPFERIVEEHGAAVLRVCRALLDPADADDAWSETFLAALESYPRLRPESDVRAWLATLAHRKAIDVLRRAARRPAGALEPSELAAPPESPESPGGESARGESAAALRAALAALPEKQRGALVLHYLAELPYADVGRLLGCSPAAARRSAADGLANLRKRTPKGMLT